MPAALDTLSTRVAERAHDPANTTIKLDGLGRSGSLSVRRKLSRQPCAVQHSLSGEEVTRSKPNQCMRTEMKEVCDDKRCQASKCACYDWITDVGR